MRPRHIAVFTYMASGHVNPYLDVCSELVARGHRVTFPASDQFSAKIRGAGVEAIELEFRKLRGPRSLFADKMCDDSLFWRRFGSVIAPWFMMEALSISSQSEEFYSKNPPDVILYDDLNLAGRIIAKQLQRPAIQLGTHFARQNSLLRVDGACTTPQPVLDLSPMLNNLMSVIGLEGEDAMRHIEPLNLFVIPREFQFDADSFDSRFKFVGVTFGRRDDATLGGKRNGDGKPLVLISEGSNSTDNRFLTLCIEAFGESRYEVVFIKGIDNCEISPVGFPKNFKVCRDIPNGAILPFADVAVCQAGMGTTLECLYHGVPVVGVPPSPFNSEVAFRIAELGVGLNVPAITVTAAALKDAVDTASTCEALRGRVRRMQCALHSNRGAELAADAIVEFVG